MFVNMPLEAAAGGEVIGKKKYVRDDFKSGHSLREERKKLML